MIRSWKVQIILPYTFLVRGHYLFYICYWYNKSNKQKSFKPRANFLVSFEIYSCFYKRIAKWMAKVSIRQKFNLKNHIFWYKAEKFWTYLEWLCKQDPYWNVSKSFQQTRQINDQFVLQNFLTIWQIYLNPEIPHCCLFISVQGKTHFIIKYHGLYILFPPNSGFLVYENCWSNMYFVSSFYCHTSSKN